MRITFNTIIHGDSRDLQNADNFPSWSKPQRRITQLTLQTARIPFSRTPTSDMLIDNLTPAICQTFTH